MLPEPLHDVSYFSPGSASQSPSTSSKCVGCGSDNAIRIHYGGASCHGCKAFFRRSIFETRKYTCSFQNNCEITPAYRNRCRACRFKNCLNGGMDGKFVREERGKCNGRSSLSRQSETPHEATPKSEAELYPTPRCDDFDRQLILDKQMIQYLVDLEVNTDRLNEHSPYGEHWDTWGRDVSIALGLHNPHLVIRRSQLDWSCSRIMGAVDMYLAWYRSFVMLADYAMGIPEFNNLPILDQTRLFKENFTAFGWIVYAFRCFQNGYADIGMPLGNGSYIPYKEYELSMMEPRWREAYGPVGKSLIELIVHPMREMSMSFNEYTILKAIALFQPDCHISPQAAHTCRAMRDRLTRLLALQIDLGHPMLTSTQKMMRVQKATLMLPSLYQIGRLEAELIQKLSPGELNELGGVPMEILNSYRPPTRPPTAH